jgi:serine/threonine protein kinase
MSKIAAGEMSAVSIHKLPCRYGKYELLKRLGFGGMAEVFLARLPGVAGFEKTVVIKRILPNRADSPDAEDAFVAEARLAAQVQHKNVVQVFELDRLESGELFMTMEYVEGTDLSRMLSVVHDRRKRIPTWLSVKIVVDVLDALAYAHALTDRDGRPRSLVHRDVTPSNIFISHTGDVKLGDFGVAKDYSREEQTRNGEVKGKIAYMSPEQLRGLRVDQRSDIFAVGVVLWECLAQRRLFGGRGKPDLEIMTEIRHGERFPPSRFRRDVHPDLDRCVLRALQPDPEGRYQDARGFQTELLDVLEQIHPGIQPPDIIKAVEDLIAGESDKSKRSPSQQAEVPTIETDPPTQKRSPSHSGPSFQDSRPGGARNNRRDTPARAYTGAVPFWVRAKGGDPSGPHGYFESLAHLKKIPLANAEISADGESWVELAEFARLTGQEGLFGARREPKNGLRNVTLLEMLARIGREKLSGTLSLGGDNQKRGPLPAELDFIDGAPTFVSTSTAQMAMPEVLVQEGLINTTDVPTLLHESLANGLSLEILVSAKHWTDAGAFRARIMKLRLSSLIDARAELFFDAEATPRGDRFASSILHLLPDAVHRGLSLRGLTMALGRRFSVPLRPAPDFSRALEAFELRRQEAHVARHLSQGSSIKTWVDSVPEYESLYLSVALVLLEAGLLLEADPARNA